MAALPEQVVELELELELELDLDLGLNSIGELPKQQKVRKT